MSSSAASAALSVSSLLVRPVPLSAINADVSPTDLKLSILCLSGRSRCLMKFYKTENMDLLAVRCRVCKMVMVRTRDSIPMRCPACGFKTIDGSMHLYYSPWFFSQAIPGGVLVTYAERPINGHAKKVR